MSVTPKLGRNARLIKSGSPSVTLAYGKNIGFDATAEIIKDYSMDSVSPAVTGAGKQTYTWKCDQLFTDNTHLAELIAGTQFNITFAPEGSPIGTTKACLLTNCTILKWSVTASESGAIQTSMSGEAQSLTPVS